MQIHCIYYNTFPKKIIKQNIKNLGNKRCVRSTYWFNRANIKDDVFRLKDKKSFDTDCVPNVIFHLRIKLVI